MFRGFLNMETPFWRWVGRIPAIIGLSLCWYLCCIPIVTIIPACCALFDSVSRGLMLDNEKRAFTRFFRSFVRGLKRGIPLTILWLVVLGSAIWGYLVAANSFGIYSTVYIIVLLILVAYLSWLIPLESRYQNSFIKLHINAFYFYLGRLPSSCLMVFSTIGVIVVAFSNPFAYILTTVAPCLIAILHTFPVEKAFQSTFPHDYDEDGLPVHTE